MVQAGVNSRGIFYFQQDGAPVNFVFSTWDLLDGTFLQRWIGRGCPFVQLPCSPDFTPPDFWLWDYLRHKVNQPTPTQLELLHDAIVKELAAIPTNMCKRATHGVFRRWQECVQANGGYVEHLFWNAIM
ncbi:MAG: hypothetical protein EZS28_016116 [Streblomastix strix]|uniref:Uncharacterized protein n=1 Tax=Streblomastix strix TaxID=222440 RepID=A0A5J4W0F3_9EUKA|nr:MAG: hypothetical protein EZS28_016116 [Streblomastix strix]